MEINWFLVGIVVVFAILLILFIIRRNLRDEKELEHFLNENNRPLDEEEDEPNRLG